MKASFLRRYMIAKALWKLACEHDGIAVDSMFSAFSDANPWAVKLNGFNAEYPAGKRPTGDVIGYSRKTADIRACKHGYWMKGGRCRPEICN